ncbi:MAG: DUF4412 domain-containing protein [Acetobacteraceae bacterium]|nr:DUF4412 domain-containing protein [Acetobacteraceae bacterium]
MRHRFSTLAALAMAMPVVSMPVWADDKPLFQPSRDVMVEYKASGMAQGPMAGGDGTLKIWFANNGRRMRIEPPNGQGAMIMDTEAGNMTVIMIAQRMYMDMPGQKSMVPMLDATNATFKKTGTDTVAGTPCTIYDTSNNDRHGEVCLTEDGVLLRGKGGDSGSRQTLEAVKVTYGSHAAGLFEPPADFLKMEMPVMPGGMPPGGMPPGRPPGR